MDSPTLIALFFFFQIFGGQIGMGLILGTVALSGKVSKHPLLISFLASWMLYSFAFCLLLYTGHQFDTERPLILCTLQVSMIHASAVSTPFAGLVLIFNIWLAARRLAYLGPKGPEDQKNGSSLTVGTDREPPWLMKVLLMVPHISYVAVILYIGMMLLSNPSFVGRSRETPYCTLASPQGRVVPYMAAVLVTGCVIMEVLVMIKLFKFKKTFGGPKTQMATAALVRISIRVGVFTGYAILSLLAALQFWTRARTDFSFAHTIQALLPVAAFLIFGTQKDLLTAWGVVWLWNRLIGGGPGRDKTPADISSLEKGPSLEKEETREPTVEVPTPERTSTVMSPASPMLFSTPSLTNRSSAISISEARRG